MVRTVLRGLVKAVQIVKLCLLLLPAIAALLGCLLLVLVWALWDISAGLHIIVLPEVDQPALCLHM